MNILHLLSSPVWSGPAEPVALLAEAQRSLGHAVSVAIDSTRTGTGSEEPAAPHLERLGLLDGRGLRLCTRDGPPGVWRDARRLATLEVDVVHAHFSHDHWVAALSGHRGVRVRSFHAARSLRGVRPGAAAFTVPTAELGVGLRRPWTVLPPLVGPGFRPAEDRPALQVALGLTAPVVGMVSTFQPSRRHAVALAAFGRLHVREPRSTLVLLGDGQLGPALRAEAQALGLSAAVRFPGYQSGEALVRWMQALDEVWVLGLGNDWAGRAALQARAVGARVVGVDEGALRNWVDELLPEPTPAALAAVALRGARRTLALPDVRRVGEELVALYLSAGARS
ncbi:MAG TPA: glycosyltransferase [Myxococcaceae bacterium]|nr:glycosyltransferase [Myxococcaceae bacterium]